MYIIYVNNTLPLAHEISRHFWAAYGFSNSKNFNLKNFFQNAENFCDANRTEKMKTEKTEKIIEKIKNEVHRAFLQVILV